MGLNTSLVDLMCLTMDNDFDPHNVILGWNLTRTKGVDCCLKTEEHSIIQHFWTVIKLHILWQGSLTQSYRELIGIERQNIQNIKTDIFYNFNFDKRAFIIY
jgi:hypothetical protein